MSQSVNLIIAKNLGCGMPECRYLPCSGGVSGRTVAVYPASSLGHYRIHSHVKIRGLKCASVGSSFVCEARRNPDFSRQNKSGFSRSKNRNNEGRDGFESFEEDMLSSKNGPLVSLSASGKSQTTSAPGPREKEIVELFKKVQARLRERASTKEEKMVDSSQGQSKENGTVDSLLKLLKKHSVEQVKRSSGGGRGKDLSLEQESSQYTRARSTKFSDFDSPPRHESQEANISFSRPRSNFQRRSPVPRIRYEPISYDGDDDVNSVSLSSDVVENNQDQIGLKHDDEPEIDTEPVVDHEPESDSEPDLDPKDDLLFPDIGIADLSDDDSHDHEPTETGSDEHQEEQLTVQHEDLSALKLTELRALAKTRGLKGFSKMKKGELMALLTAS